MTENFEETMHSIMEQQAKQVVTSRQVSSDAAARKAAILAQYAQISDGEGYPHISLPRLSKRNTNICSNCRGWGIIELFVFLLLSNSKKYKKLVNSPHSIYSLVVYGQLNLWSIPSVSL